MTILTIILIVSFFYTNSFKKIIWKESVNWIFNKKI